MKQEEIDEIIDCLPKGKTYFHYFAEKYALMLLSWHAREGRPIRQIRQSNFARLLDKKAVRSVLPTLGDGVLKADSLGIWPEMGECYFLTLGTIFECQNSRKGQSLVLHLNFSSQHDQPYRHLIQPKGRPFECDCHPMDEKYHTLAWARIDIDLNNREALIEEIQSDWVWYGLNTQAWLKYYKSEEDARKYLKRKFGDATTNDPKRFRRYLGQTLRPHIKMWDEAMLAATLWFLRDELGVRWIFYHTFETGNWLKNMRSWGKPPRSIYTDLPKQFCFQETLNPPSFIMRSRRKWTIKELEKLKFYVLEV